MSSVYLSKHLTGNRNRVGRISNLETYDRYYDIAVDAIERKKIPLVTLSAGSLLIRTTWSDLDSEQALTIDRGAPGGFDLFAKEKEKKWVSARTDSSMVLKNR